MLVSTAHQSELAICIHISPFSHHPPIIPDKILNAEDPANWRRGVWWHPRMSTEYGDVSVLYEFSLGGLYKRLTLIRCTMMLCDIGQLSLQPHRFSVSGSMCRVALVTGMGALHLLHISAFSSLWLTCLPSAWPTNSRNTCRALDRNWHHSWRPPAGRVIPLDPSILLRREKQFMLLEGSPYSRWGFPFAWNTSAASPSTGTGTVLSVVIVSLISLILPKNSFHSKRSTALSS